MKITHSFHKKEISKYIEEDVSFMLTNNKGNYLMISEEEDSKYKGFFVFYQDDMFKILDSIKIKDKDKTGEIVNAFFKIDRYSKHIKEEYFIPDEQDALVYSLNEEKEIEINFDIKKSYDNRSFGRIYEVYQEKNALVIKFTKKTDRSEDDTHENKEYEAYVAIVADNLEIINKDDWVRKYYNKDEERGSYPFERYVYNALNLICKKVVIAFSDDKKDALRVANLVFSKTEKFMKLKENKLKSLHYRKDLHDEEVKFAYICAQHSLKSLYLEDKKRLFAGLPWFFHYWTRDEAISLKALMNIDKVAAKSIFFEELKHISHDGRIINRIPQTVLGAADATGWVFRRINDYLEKYRLNKKEKEIVIDRLEHSLYLLEKFMTKDHLEYNHGQETWMDTVNDGDNRSGFRIEIQALRLSMYRFITKLTDNLDYFKSEVMLKNEVRDKFWNRKWLADGLDDLTKRPNIFIAYYIYKDILDNDEWVRCFDNIIKSLWLSWGGVSTIDKTSHLFCDTYSGEKPISYHRGDSWFFINDIAAISMAKLDKIRYKHYIDAILKSSTKDILWKGIIGSGSEVSSAKEQKAQGCLNQAWSNAMYTELVDELYQ